MTNPPNKGKSAVLDWLNAHVNFDGDECLIWPFSRRHGYAGGMIRGKSIFPCRIMCEKRNGPAPTPKHEAAHSCGRGHLGCIHPGHLSWKTRAQNQQDRRRHGTQANAYWGRVGKLKAADVLKIRALKGRMTEVEIGKMFGVTPTNINKIHNGRRWQSVQSR